MILRTAALLCAVVAALSCTAETLRFERSVRTQIGDLPVVILRGTAEERARAFGALSAREFVQLLDRAMIPAVNARSPKAWDELVAATERLFDFPAGFQAGARAYIEGTAKSLPPGERRLATLDREIKAGDLLALHAFPDLVVSGRVPLGGCSSFSAWGSLTEGGGVITGRNLDYFTFPHPIPVFVIAQEPSEAGLLRTIEVSVPGILGASTAMNEHGVFISLNDEPGLPPSKASGWISRVVPLRPAIETARADNAVMDVANQLRGAPLAAGGIIHVSFPASENQQAGAAVIEWDGNEKTGGVTIRRAGVVSDSIHCTNHYLDRRKEAPHPNSQERFASLTSGLKSASTNRHTVDLAAAKKLLASAAVSGPVSTCISVIALPEKRTLWVAIAPRPGASATDGTWTEIAWDKVFAN